MFSDGLEEFDSSREVVQSLIEEYKVSRPHGGMDLIDQTTRSLNNGLFVVAPGHRRLSDRTT